MTAARHLKQRKGTVLVAVWMPLELKEALDRAARLSDSDRSKFIRAAVRDLVKRGGKTTSA